MISKIDFSLFHREHPTARETDMWFFAEHAETRCGIGDILETTQEMLARMATAADVSANERKQWTDAALIMKDALEKLRAAKLEKLGAEF